MSKASTIAKDFPTAATPDGAANWRALVDKLLAGKPYADLCHTSDDGIVIDPAPMAQNHITAHQKHVGGCVLTSLIDSGTVKSANDDILRDLAGGAAALHLVINIGGTSERGIKVNDKGDLATLLDGVYLDYIPISIEAGVGQSQAQAMLSDLYKAKNIEQPTTSSIGIYGSYYHNLGASEAQELAFMLASGVTALRQLEAGGVSVENGAKHLSFHMSLDSDVFMGMAKLRAFRYIWGEALKAMGTKNQPASINVQTSRRMMSNVDIETNILRTTAASFAAMLGGANSLAVLPYDVAKPSPDTHRKARRIARNITIILDEEGHLNNAEDVATGSYSLESLTAQLAENAWKIFQMLEYAGGMDKALASGIVEDLISPMVARRKMNILAGNKTIIGVNAFQNPNEGGAK